MAFKFNCQHGRHLTVADAKSCQAGTFDFADDQDTFDGAARAEMDYERYLEDRGADESELQDRMEAAAGVVPFDEALRASQDDWSSRLLRQHSNNAKARTAIAERPVTLADGHYALEVDGVVKFYMVESPTEGKWKGWTFLSAQAGDERHPIKNKSVKAGILAAIAADPKAAMLRYGREIGRCGHCNRTLTDPDSRARGIGPICAGKLSY